MARRLRAVAEDMAQDFKPIMQDGNLVGYLVFTQLEKASAGDGG